MARKQLSLVAAIALYYAYFHLIAGIMCIDPGISFRELPYFPLDRYRSRQYDYHDFVEKQGDTSRKLTHAKVKEFARKYERLGILAPNASLLFENLKVNRITVNYRPNYFGIVPMKSRLREPSEELTVNFDRAVPLILLLNRDYGRLITKSQLLPSDLFVDMEAFIWDGIGDDFVASYLGWPQEKGVWRMFKRHAKQSQGLTIPHN